MRYHLPRQHRMALAAGLFLVALVTGTWLSAQVGDPHPEVWGVLLGLLGGGVVAVLVLSPGRAGSPDRR